MGDSDASLSLRDPSNNAQAEATSQPQWHLLPGGDEPPVAGVIGPHVPDGAPPQVVLPLRGRGCRAPLFLEPESGTAFAGTAEVEYFLSSCDGPLEQVPIHEHV